MSSRFCTACSSLCSSLLRAVYIPARVSLPIRTASPLLQVEVGVEAIWPRRTDLGSQVPTWEATPRLRPQSTCPGEQEEALENVPRARVNPLVKEHTFLEGAGKSKRREHG